MLCFVDTGLQSGMFDDGGWLSWKYVLFVLSRRSVMFSLSSLVQVSGCFFTLCLFVFGSSLAFSQDSYPSKPIRIITPYPVGGTSDAVMWDFTEAFGREIGQPIVYEHKPGAATNIGAQFVARSAADGYTILLGNVALVRNRWFGPRPAYDLYEDLSPVTKLMDVGGVISANMSFRPDKWTEVIELSKASGKRLTIASAQGDVIIAQITDASGIELLHVPYKGGGPALTDVMGGHVDMIWGFLPAQYGYIRSGKIKPLAVTSTERLPQLPDTPTLREIGVDYGNDAWYGLFVPAGTSQEIIDKIAAVTRKVLNRTEIIEKIRSVGAEPVATTPLEFSEIIKREDESNEKDAKRYPDLVGRFGK